MLSPPYVLAFDLGTTACKGILVDSEGHIISKMIKNYSLLIPKGGYIEQNPMIWWKTVRDIALKILKRGQPDYVVGVGFCGTMAAALPIDRAGKPLRNALLYADTRAIDQIKKLSDEFGNTYIYELTGNPLSPVYSLAKWMWIKENEPRIFEKTFKFLQPKDFLVYKFTGEIVTDYVDASATMAFDVKKKEWVERLLEFAGIPLDKLPEPRPSISIAGELTTKSAYELGLSKNLPVIVGSGDTAALLTGAGAVEDGYATIYLGGAAEIDLTTNNPLFDPNARIPVRCHAIPNMWFNSASAMTSGTALRWFLNNFCGKTKNYGIIDREATKISPGAGGLIFLPYLAGERAPIWDPKARGAFIGISLLSKQVHLYRAILEGIAFSLRSIMDSYKEMGADFKGVSISGGGAKSELWKRIIADVLGIECCDLAHPEDASALGVAMYTYVALKNMKMSDALDKFVKIEREILPDENNRNIYNVFYDAYCKCYPALAEIMHTLATYA